MRLPCLQATSGRFCSAPKHEGGENPAFTFTRFLDSVILSFPPMKRTLVLGLLCAVSALAEPLKEWIDPATGHRVVRLSKEPGSASLYFHQNAYTPQGDKLIITTPSGLATVNLTNYGIEVIVPRAS